MKFQESIGNTNVDDVMIKIHGLHVYYADASRKKEWVLDHWSDESKMTVMKNSSFFVTKSQNWILTWKNLNYFMKVVKRFLSTLFLKEKFHCFIKESLHNKIFLSKDIERTHILKVLRLANFCERQIALSLEVIIN